MGAQDDILAGQLNVTHDARVVYAHGVHVQLALAIGLQGVVVAVYEDGSTGQKAGIHAHAVSGLDFDGDEPLPMGAFTLHIRTELAEETALELVDFSHSHAHDEWLRSGDITVDDEDVVKFVVAGRGNAGALVDLSGIEKVKDGHMLDAKYTVHAFEAEAALAVQEVGYMRLAEAGLGSELQAG